MGRRKHKFSSAVEKALRRLQHMRNHPEDLDVLNDHESNQGVVTIPRSQVATASAQSDQLAIAWRRQFVEVRNRFPAHTRNTMSIRMSGFSITDVYADGRIVGQYANDDDVCNVFASFADPVIGCSCRKSNGQYICEHTFGFVQKILAEFGERGELVRRVNAGQFSSKPFDIRHFKFDETSERINQLSMYLDRHVDKLWTALPPIALVSPKRVGWHLDFYPRPTLSMAVQEMNKRGDRWKKGQTASPHSLEDSVQRTDADKAVMKLIDNPAWSSTIQSEVAEALLHLVGQSNVVIETTEYEVVAGNASLKLEETDRGWCVRPIETTAASSHLEFKFASDGVIAISSSERRLYLTCCPGVRARCMEKLVGIPPVREPNHVQMLTERCQQLQELANIILPSKFGQVIEESVTPVVLLRCRPEGFVEYGLRVRDSHGTLQIPGKGKMIFSTIENNQPVQRVRSCTKEFAILHELQSRLNLDRGSVYGQVSIERGLSLVEALQKRSDKIEVLWDEHSETPLRSLGTLSNQNVRVAISQKRDWFQLNGKCELDGGNIDLSELMATLASPDAQSIGGYMRIGDHGWAKISEELKEGLQKLADSVHVERGQMKFDRTAAIAMRDLQECIQVDATKPWQQCLERLSVAEALEPEVPKTLNAELRDYQAAGFKWLRRLAEWGVGGVLADDMGLGKTVQTLAVLVDRADRGPSLVIAPTSVGFNWLREAQRFAPGLIVHSYRDTDRNEFFQELGPGHLVVCSYGLALRDADKLSKIAWSNLVLDEAQAIKNSQSKTSQAIAGIDADWKVALTGTPVENHLGELWSLFRIISPGLFGGWEQFRRRFATPIEKNKDEARRLALRDRLKPFILRRTKREVLKDLPARTEQNLVVELSPQERQVYDKYRLSILNQANEIAKLSDVKDQRFKLLALLTRLRQIACHVRLVEDAWNVRSTKLESLLETLKELKEEGHRTLIFSQFVQHLHLIRTMLDEEKITYQYLDGSTTPAQRQEQVDKFQNGDATAFLISLKAGGTGLNLTAADYVIHMDPWWNPAVEDQATDRAHRIGQTKPVMVYRLIAKNTVEEEILKLHEDKRDLVAGILDGTHEASSLSTQELIKLLTQ